MKVDDLGAALTEQRDPRSESLEQMSTRELVELFVEEEKFVQEALRGAIVELTSAVELVAKSLRNGGRLFYVGAGAGGWPRVVEDAGIPPAFCAGRGFGLWNIAGGAAGSFRRDRTAGR